MKFESGKTYKVRCGWEAYIYDTNAPGGDERRIMGKIIDNKGGQRLHDWNEYGIDRYHKELDLVPPKRTCWVGFSKEGEPVDISRQKPNRPNIYVASWVKMVEVDNDV